MNNKNDKEEDNNPPVFELISDDFLSNSVEVKTSNINPPNFVTNISVLKEENNIENSSDSLAIDISRRILLQSQLAGTDLGKKDQVIVKKDTEIKDIEVEDVNLTGEFIIDEFSLSFLGLKISYSIKKDVIAIMEKYSKNIVDETEDKFSYGDLGVSFSFMDNILHEIVFFIPFKHSTSKGLKLDDPIEKALKIYGKPKMKTKTASIWTNITTFFDDGRITSIKLKA